MPTTSFPDLGVLELPASFFKRGPLVTGDGHKIDAETRFELLDLVHRFEWTNGAANRDALNLLLTDDIVIDHGMGQARGKAEMESLAVPFNGLRHLMTNHVPFIDDQGRVNILCHMTVFVAEGDNAPADLPMVLDTGLDRYVFRHEDGVWKIAEIHFTQQRLAVWSGAPDFMIAQMAETQSARDARLAG